MRNNLSKTVIVDSPNGFLDLMDNYRIDIVSVNQLNDEAFMFTYNEKSEYIEEHASSNIVNVEIFVHTKLFS